MRYMGDAAPAPAIPGLPSFTPATIDPAARAQLVAAARGANDDQASLLVDMADASPLGHKTEIMRYGIGAVVGGLVVGLGVFIAMR